MTWKRSSTWMAVEQRLRTTLRNACHMSLATNTIALERSSPSMSKKVLKDLDRAVTRHVQQPRRIRGRSGRRA